MFTRLPIATTLVQFATLSTIASDFEDDVKRTKRAAQVFKEIMDTPDRGIPHGLLKSAKCTAIIPGDVSLGLALGCNYGSGLATRRTDNGSSAPMFVAIDGGSVGCQIGETSADTVLFFMSDRALRNLRSDKFKLGADASRAPDAVVLANKNADGSIHDMATM